MEPLRLIGTELDLDLGFLQKVRQHSSSDQAQALTDLTKMDTEKSYLPFNLFAFLPAITSTIVLRIWPTAKSQDMIYYQFTKIISQIVNRRLLTENIN